MDFYVSPEVKDAAEMVAGTLEGAIIFYSPEEAGAMVVVYNYGPEGESYVVDIDENGKTRSGDVVFETGWTA